jgi:hypothetical protein
MNDLGNYREFLESFQSAGYEFLYFRELTKPLGQFVLRHDIDFDTGMAAQCAVIERELGVKATYFFLLRSKFYNIYSAQDFENVKKIQALGHEISIHFDPVIYDDFHAGLRKEVSLFTQIFETDVRIISLHRPNTFFQSFDEPIFGIEHTYQSKYFKKVKYFADSTGVWRHGHPGQSEDFKERKSLHVLIHPVWWMTDAANNKEKLKVHYAQRLQELKKEFCANCIPFRDIYDQV